MHEIEIPWPASGSGGMSEVEFRMLPDEIYSCHFRTPEELGPKNGYISLFEFDGQPCQRTGCLSETLGSLTDPIPGDGTAFKDTTAVSVTFQGSEQKKKVALLEPNTDYYLNVQLANPPDSGVFNTKVQFQKPRS